MEKTPYSLLDSEDNEFLINLLPSWVTHEMQGIPKEARKHDFAALTKLAKPSILEEKLRVNFWEEYKRVIESREEKMNMANVYAGYCDIKAFKEIIRKSKYKLAYILTPTPTLNSALEDLIQLGSQQMRAVLMVVPVDDEGKLDKSIATLQKEIWQTAVKLKHGSLQTVNVNSKSLQVVANQPLQNIEKEVNVTPAVEVVVEPEKPIEIQAPVEPLPTFSQADLEADLLSELIELKPEEFSND